MSTWAWIALYLVAFGALQMVLYRYFGGRPSASAVTGAEGGAGSATAPSRTGEAAITCGHCGARNDRHPRIRFCRDCLAPLQ